MSDLNIETAKKLMGWTEELREGCTIDYIDKHDLYVMGVINWKPAENLSQALEVLAKFNEGKHFGNIVPPLEFSTVGSEWVLAYLGDKEEDVLTLAFGKDIKDAPKAICEIILGEESDNEKATN